MYMIQQVNLIDWIGLNFFFSFFLSTDFRGKLGQTKLVTNMKMEENLVRGNLSSFNIMK